MQIFTYPLLAKKGKVKGKFRLRKSRVLALCACVALLPLLYYMTRQDAESIGHLAPLVHSCVQPSHALALAFTRLPMAGDHRLYMALQTLKRARHDSGDPALGLLPLDYITSKPIHGRFVDSGVLPSMVRGKLLSLPRNSVLSGVFYHVALPSNDRVQYMSMVRRPLDRSVAAYNKIKHKLNPALSYEECVVMRAHPACTRRNQMVKLFCGQADVCSGAEHGSRAALDHAKAVVESSYVVVGVVEAYTTSVEIMEQVVPRLLGGLEPGGLPPIDTSSLLAREVQQPDVVDLLAQWHALDLELYEWLALRLEKQARSCGSVWSPDHRSSPRKRWERERAEITAAGAHADGRDDH